MPGEQPVHPPSAVPEPNAIGSKLKGNFQKNGPRFPSWGRGAYFFPRCKFVPFVCLFASFLFISFRCSRFCFVNTERRVQLHLETVARPRRGSSPSPALLGSAKSPFWWGKRLSRNPQPGKASPGKESNGTACAGRPGPELPVCLSAGRAGLPK